MNSNIFDAMIFLIILVALLLTIIVIILRNKPIEFSESQLRPDKALLPTTEIKNDKLVLVKEVSKEQIKNALEYYCVSNNELNYIILPRLITDNKQFVITFPYDIDFENFCYFINYLNYSDKIESKPNIKAWCTTKPRDRWMTKLIVNKPVMIYIPDWDEGYDNVYLTTNKNMGFQMGFAVGHHHKELKRPAMRYEENPIDIQSLSENEKIDFK